VHTTHGKVAGMTELSNIFKEIAKKWANKPF
jgi:hypothetical protein